MTVIEPVVDVVGRTDDEGDPFDARRACRAPEVLGPFNRAGVLSAADVHVARCLLRLGGEDAGEGGGEGGGAGGGAELRHAVLLAAALAVRAPRLGHVCSDILTVARTIALDSDLPLDVGALPWPEPGRWINHLEACGLVACGEDHTQGNEENEDDGRPLRLVGTKLYLDRYWREERQVAADLLARAQGVAAGVDPAALSEGLARLFLGPHAPGDAVPDHQRLAAATAVLRRFSVVAGGPGTGKTTTVARILALLHEQAEATGAPPPLVALAAPTGKAAARMEEAVHEEAARLDVSGTVRERLLAVEASTLHRLLGWRPGNRSRFRHHRGNRLAHEVVVVDETSMVSLSLMARLVEAVRPAARLVLVGDPEQLASVEAGAVLGDIVGPAAAGLLMGETARRRLSGATGQQVPASEPPAGAGTGIGDGIVVLRHVHRFGGGIAALAEAVRKGDAEAAVDLLRGAGEDLMWVPGDIAGAGANGPDAVRQAAVQAATSVIEAARAGRARSAIDALGAFRVLCAHRHGPYGVATWMERVERWLSVGIEGFAGQGDWYAGRPLLVTENDYGLRLFNGDTGVVVAADPGSGRLSAVFDRRGQLLEFSPTRLAAVDTVYAMTVHKSQGSQFDTVAVLLPDPTSPILTRELLYTAVTRARRRLILAGTEEAVRIAAGRPIARNSGLRDRLWGSGETADGRYGRTQGHGAGPAGPPTVRKP